MDNILITVENVKNALKECIKEYIRIETDLNLSGTSYIEGQISILACILDLPWKYKETGKCYYEYINNLIETLDLDIKERLTPADPNKEVHNDTLFQNLLSKIKKLFHK